MGLQDMVEMMLYKSVKFKCIIIFIRIKQYIEVIRHKKKIYIYIYIYSEQNYLFQIHDNSREAIVGSLATSKFDSVIEFVILLWSKRVIGMIQ